MNDHGLEDVAQNLRATTEGITRSIGLVASDLSMACHRVENDLKAKDEEIDKLRAKLGAKEDELAVALRNKERFRYALWVYLQERDGIAGQHAPTPETLTLIRDLIQELE